MEPTKQTIHQLLIQKSDCLKTDKELRADIVRMKMELRQQQNGDFNAVFLSKGIKEEFPEFWDRIKQYFSIGDTLTVSLIYSEQEY